MKAIYVLMALIAAMDLSDWKDQPGALLISSASIWMVNKPNKVTPKEVVRVFQNAKVAKPREPEPDQKDLSILVFEKDSFLTLDKDAKSETGRIIINQNEFLSKLKEMQVNVPSQVDIANYTSVGSFETVDDITKAAESASSTPKTWNLLGRSSLPASAGQTSTTVPEIDHSILIEWGHKDAIESLIKRLQAVPKTEILQATNSVSPSDDKLIDASINPVELYNYHFEKLPLSLKVTSSRADEPDTKDPQEIGRANPLFLVRAKNPPADSTGTDPNASKRGGYLLYMRPMKQVSANGESHLLEIIALHVPKFILRNGEFQVSIPAECFMKEVIKPSLLEEYASTELTLPTLSESDAIAKPTTIFVPSRLRREEQGKNATDSKSHWDLQLVFSKNAPAASTPTTQTGVNHSAIVPQPAATNKIRFSLVNKVRAIINKVQIEVDQDAVPPISEQSPITIYDENCQPMVLRAGPAGTVAPQAPPRPAVPNPAAAKKS